MRLHNETEALMTRSCATTFIFRPNILLSPKRCKSLYIRQEEYLGEPPVYYDALQINHNHAVS